MAQLARGCRDILGSSAVRRRRLIAAFSQFAARYGFNEIETPVLEHASLYTASLGETSDVVASEMYILKDTSPPLVLRPEGTAGVSRALMKAGRGSRGSENVWYAGPMFRRERPQRGRHRQFFQMGVESIGDDGITVDLDVIEMAHHYLRDVAGVRFQLRLNTLGTFKDREKYNLELWNFLSDRQDQLSSISKRRFQQGNVMRVLDSKLDEDLQAIQGAPLLQDYVGSGERERFMDLQALLQEASIPYVVDFRLVRGLDYYTSTAFEFDGPGGRAVCAGGRYMDVAGASGVGFAIGLDRIEGEEEAEFGELANAVVVVGLDEGAQKAESEVGRMTRRIVRELRGRKCRAVGRWTSAKLGRVVTRSIKAGAMAIVVVGEDEVAGGFATVKFVRTDGRIEEPVRVSTENILELVCQRVTPADAELIKMQDSSPYRCLPGLVATRMHHPHNSIVCEHVVVLCGGFC